ncbi:MAG: VirB3 family type IV secretion system protein [Candidatus Adiutrix sp.]|jgi:type IV secretion system protein VirB3/type IV secretion system protein VirB4|nr:VirB3 family type IV secretion system protein [Candidatus Adiutrix sp.]
MRAPIRRSLHRQALVLGGDRELVMFSALGAFLTALGGFSLISALCGLVFWLIALYWLRKWAKKDPLMRHVWLRHIKQQDSYSAKTPLFHRGPVQAGPWGRGWSRA